MDGNNVDRGQGVISYEDVDGTRDASGLFFGIQSENGKRDA